MNSFYIAAQLLRRIFAERQGWIAHLILPVVILSLIVSFVGGDGTVSPTRVGVVNTDRGELGSQVADALTAMSFELVPMTEAEMRKQIMDRELSLGFTIPADYTESLLEGRTAAFQQYYLTREETSYQLEIVLNQLARQMEQTVTIASEQGGGEQGILERVDQVWTQQAKQQVRLEVMDSGLTMNGALYLVIGFMLFFVMNSILGTIGLIMEDRKQGTMGRTYTAPVRSIEIASGNFLGSFVLGFLQIALTLAITKYLLDFDYGLSFIELLVIFAFFLLAAVGIGSAVASLVKHSSNLSQMNAIIITPTCMLGGCWWPLSVMPDFMQKLANFVPQRWAIDAAESLAAGAGWSGIAMQLGIMSLFAVVFLGVGAAVLRPSQEAL